MLHLLPLLFAADPVVLPLSAPGDTVRIPLPVRIEEVKDLRKLGRVDPRLVGVTEIGMFEERAALRTPRPLAEEVKELVGSWALPDSGAFPARIELLSMESWPVMEPGPDPIKVRLRLRVVSTDPSRPGTILSPEATGENKGFQSAPDQMALVRGALRDALGMLKQGMKPVPDTSSPLLMEPDTGADPRRIPPPPGMPTSVKQTVWVSATPAFQTFSMALRYSQHTSPQAGWTLEYWGALQFRGPWTGDDYTNVWSGEVQGGQAWWRRLDDGRSSWALVGSLGALAGTETFRRVSKTDSGTISLGHQAQYWYLGGTVRGGIRWDAGEGLIAESGIEVDVRAPTVIAWFDPAIYLQAGWTF